MVQGIDGSKTNFFELLFSTSGFRLTLVRKIAGERGAFHMGRLVCLNFLERSMLPTSSIAVLVRVIDDRTASHGHCNGAGSNFCQGGGRVSGLLVPGAAKP